MTAIQCAVVECQRTAIVRCEQCKQYYCGEHSQVNRLPPHAGRRRKAVRVYCIRCAGLLEREAPEERSG